jgi:hypothetical protein
MDVSQVSEPVPSCVPENRGTQLGTGKETWDTQFQEKIDCSIMSGQNDLIFSFLNLLIFLRFFHILHVFILEKKFFGQLGQNNCPKLGL